MQCSGQISLPFVNHAFKIITDSKLLLVEDMDFLDVVLSSSNIVSQGSSRSRSKHIFLAASSTLASCITLLKNRSSPFLPLSLTLGLCSTYSIWLLYKNCRELNKDKYLSHCIQILQSLCSQTHKIFRFIKETEIISTGQVSACNLGSVMGIPVNISFDPNKHPPWKTLPLLRKCLANSLIKLIDLLLVACGSIKKYTAAWLSMINFVAFCNVTPKDSSIYKMVNSLRSKHYISTEELQTLIDVYTVLQSEFLKYVALCFCPLRRSFFEPLVIYKPEIFQMFNSIEPVILDIASRLKTEFNMQKMFLETERKVALHSGKAIDKTTESSFNDLQYELHQIFLLVLSTVQKSKDLEDCVEKFAYSNEVRDVASTGIEKVFSQDFIAIKNDLEEVIKMYNDVLERLVSNKKTEPVLFSKLVLDSKMGRPTNNSSPSDHSGEGHVETCSNTLNINSYSPDEVFLAVSGSKRDYCEADSENWCFPTSIKSRVPNTLMMELTSTLKPIKKGFQEREKIALERAGIQDIDNYSDSKSEEESDLDVSTERQCINQSKMKSYHLLNKESTDSSCDYCEDFSFRPNTQEGPSKSFKENDASIGHICYPSCTSKQDEKTLEKSEGSEFHSNMSLFADIIKMRSQKFSTFTGDEESYSNEEPGDEESSSNEED